MPTAEALPEPVFPATASAEGAQFNGRPFPATAWAEGPQLNAAPSPSPVWRGHGSAQPLAKASESWGSPQDSAAKSLVGRVLAESPGALLPASGMHLLTIEAQ